MQTATEPEVRLERQPHRDAAERLRRIYRLLRATDPTAASIKDTSSAPEADSNVVVQEAQP